MTGFEFPKVTEVLAREGFRPVKGRDQHFLRGRGPTRQIAELCRLTPEHRVLEIGAGLGNLSAELALRAGRVTAVEKDRTFEGWHARLAAELPNLTIHYDDFLKVDIEAVAPAEPEGGPLVAVGNLPYQITAPILFKLVDSAVAWERIVVMVQLEVAERIVAGPGTRRSSALTYKLAFEYDAEIAMRLGPNEFIPPPRVHSAVVVLTPRADRLLTGTEHKRRLHALVLGGRAADRAVAEAAAAAAGLDPKARPETLGLGDFLRLDESLRALGA
jgi:16S rRNA (adenine1518-N6/adenine1519-N6)-dimethyltransferase